MAAAALSHRIAIVVLAVVACKRAEAQPASQQPAPASTPELAKTGVRVCDAFTADFASCIRQAPEDARAELTSAMQQSIATWNDGIAQGRTDVVVGACYAARDGAEQTLGPAGCAFAHIDDPPRPAVALGPVSLPKIGIAECDLYLQEYPVCIREHVPEAARGAMWDALEATAKAWREAADLEVPGLADACKDALAAAHEATTQMGCTITMPADR